MGASSRRVFLALGAGVTAAGAETTSQPRTSRRLCGFVSVARSDKMAGNARLAVDNSCGV